MKQLTTYNRAAGYLNKLFDLLNQHFFESELSKPTITIQSTPKAYGHFSLRDDAWVSTLGATHEINIGAGTLARPIEAICATLLHEMCHYYAHLPQQTLQADCRVPWPDCGAWPQIWLDYHTSQRRTVGFYPCK